MRMNTTIRKLWMGTLLALTVLPAFAYTEWVDGVEWSYGIGAGGAVVMNATPVEGFLTVPSILVNQPVAAIGARAFRSRDRLMSVTIPEGIVSIGDEAFYGCSGLETLNLPSTVTNIGNMAFEQCNGI